MSKKYINTLESYGYRENNRMIPSNGTSYKVKVSDKDGNIITIEKDDALYACVKLAFDVNSGILSLLDAAHNDSVLAEIEMPNADYIYNCRFDEELNAILFDVKSLYGNETDTIELDVASIIELYEAGQGIEIGEKDTETGRKPISVKLAENDGLLTLTDEGLGIDGKVVTDEELESALSVKADIEYVNELFSDVSGLTSGITEVIELVEEHDEKINKIQRIIGTDEEVPSLFEQIETNREDIAAVDAEIGEISNSVDTISGKIETFLSDLEAETNRAISSETLLNGKIDEEKETRETRTVANVDYIPSAKTINFLNSKDEIIDSIDTTDFVKDGMVDSVTLETVSGTTYLIITWNTAAGKDVTRIDIGDVFEADDYYTKIEIDGKITAINTAIENETTERRNADLDLLEALDTETRNLQNQISAETQSREEEDAILADAISTETRERVTNDNALSAQVTTEIANRISGDNDLHDLLDDEIANRISADSSIRQYVFDEISSVSGAINTVSADLSNETTERLNEFNSISSSITYIEESFASKEYVDNKDSEWAGSVYDSATTSSNEYSDIKNDELEVELKLYCDSGYTDLANSISENATKINVISNLKGVSGSDTSNYDDTGNGILDVLHKEFHEFENEALRSAVGAQIKNDNEIALGKYNISNKEVDQELGIDVPSGCTIFSIGIGTNDNNRKNAVEVRMDGSVYLWIEGEFMNINKLLGQISHEVYDVDY